MVGVAQLAERWLVEPEVAGSSPVVHPTENGSTSVGPFLFKRLLSPEFVEPGSARTGEVRGPSFFSRSKKVVAVAQTLDRTEMSHDTDLSEQTVLGQPWITLVWNDPVNLMSYVSWVFRSYFGVDTAEANRLMLLVHNEGRAVVATGTREEMERHVEAMHDYGLWATLQKVDA
ncbi:MAG: ATP-dependent Clp protease adapter ClpS [Glaciihabitans sp.]|nr:ATP-dependent Clp protease adapter ClpS [Glaciihabitans sp.]